VALQRTAAGPRARPVTSHRWPRAWRRSRRRASGAVYFPARLRPPAGADVTLTDEILDRIDEIVPPGTDVGTLDMAYRPPAIQRPDLRRRIVTERAAA
jgi:hypothetical protein